MKAIFSILLAIVGCLAAFSCAHHVAEKPQKPADVAKPASEGPQLVGRIASIPADRRFVLIQRYGKWSVESGKILTTRGPDDRTANLLATGESLGEFAAADLQAGRVEVGDAVYTQHVAKPTAVPKPPDRTENPSEGGGDEILKNN